MPKYFKCTECVHFVGGKCDITKNVIVSADSERECFTFEHIADASKMVSDAVNHPSHYTQGGIECIEALKAATVGLEGIEAVCTANAIKYLWRWKHKNGVEDIEKAIFYLNRLRKEVTGSDES